jgi:hypothetical protein
MATTRIAEICGFPQLPEFAADEQRFVDGANRPLTLLASQRPNWLHGSAANGCPATMNGVSNAAQPVEGKKETT